LDNGATWSQDMAISDVSFAKPLQPDANVQATFVGSYNHTSFSNDGNGSYAYQAWTDGRVSIDGSPQQDVFFDKIAPVPAFVVTTTDDHADGICDATDCTLREAIAAANAHVGEDRIEFAPGVTGVIQLGGALPSIVSNIEIAGPGARLLSVQRDASAGSIRIFNVTAASAFSTISGLTIADGSTSSSGGGISNAGTLFLAKVTIDNNHALNGGGIFNNFGTLTITGSTISGNSVSGILAGSGGGIFNSGGSVSISNSTISGNSAIGPGGNSDSAGGIITNVGSVVLANSTIAFNSGDIGGGIRNINGGTVRSRNTIIALNTSASGPDVNGPFLSDGFNLIGNDGGANASITSAGGDQIGTAQSPIDPLLESLQDNGGPTFTHALRGGSPAMDRGRSSGVSADQRGLLRTADLPYVTNATNGDGSDIGAFEFQSDVIFRDGLDPGQLPAG
jgi:CSLREA domain-containing protein